MSPSVPFERRLQMELFVSNFCGTNAYNAPATEHLHDDRPYGGAHEIDTDRCGRLDSILPAYQQPLTIDLSSLLPHPSALFPEADR